MGGGDLNSKKSWHPNTLKNQERVWKAEQAAAEEKKRILELQRERGEERDRAELNELSKRNFGPASSSDDRLHWMYDKPDKKVLEEDYLLGKAIDKNVDQLDKGESDVIPAVARRVVGSSMIATAGDSQVDLARKIREDPLLLVKERERAARAALLNNPLHRRKLTELLRQEQEKKSKSTKTPKKKVKDLDIQLAAKLNALGADKGIDLASLLESDDSSSDSSSSSEEEKKSKKKKKKRKQEKHAKKKSKKSKKKKSKKDTESSDDEQESHKTKHRPEEIMKNSDYRNRERSVEKNTQFYSRKRKSDQEDSDRESKYKRDKRDDASERGRYTSDCRRERRRDSDDDRRGREERRPSPQRYARRDDSYREKRKGLSDEERAARVAAMAAAGVEREAERGRRVAAQRATDDDVPRTHARFQNEARALPDSLESRIHSNRHYIQRDRRHMNENFARR